jgi:glutathione S-transferase
MPLILYAHPLSSYCQKVLIALYEHDVPFEFKLLSPEKPQNEAELTQLWPLKLMPILVDGDRVLRESSIIIEYIDLYYAKGPGLIPEDSKAALDVRFFDRVFDNHVMAHQQKIVFDFLRPEGAKDAYGVTQARERLDAAYAWLESTLADGWAVGNRFSLADCAASPAVFYGSKTQPFNGRFPRLEAYLARLEARPSIARARQEARPYWKFFPFAD